MLIQRTKSSSEDGPSERQHANDLSEGECGVGSHTGAQPQPILSLGHAAYERPTPALPIAELDNVLVNGAT